MSKRGFIFLDRDDTVIYDVPYLNNPELVKLTPGAGTALGNMARAGFGLVLISNQSGVGRGLVTLEQLAAVNSRMQELLLAEDADARFDAVLFCPHRPDENCACRKPRTGMLEKACTMFDVDLASSVMIGDLPNDIKMGRTFGIRTVQVCLPGKNKESGNADYSCTNLLEASNYLLAK